MQKLLPAITYYLNKEITIDSRALANLQKRHYLRIMYRTNKNLKARVVTRVSKSVEKEVIEGQENKGLIHTDKAQYTRILTLT